MNRTLLATGLSLVMCGLGVTQASATPIVPDPIVRTRGGGGSIQIFAPLPFTFDFGAFPNDPDGAGSDCTVGPDTEHPELTAVSCNFQNLTGSTINELNFTFGGSPDPFELTLEDTSGFFSASIPPAPFFSFTAHFDGSGVESGFCPAIEGACTGGEFGIDLVGFPDGTMATVTSASAVPEPATLLLVGPGLALAAKARRRWRRNTAYLD